MAGETWREILQIGLETTYAVAAAATRKVFVEDPSITRTRQPRPKRFPTGTRDNQRAHTLGPVEVGGSVKLAMSPSELLEWATLFFGAAVVTTPGGATLARLHTFKPTNTPKSGTLERFDGANLLRATGLMANGMTIAGTPEAENTASFDLFGSDYAPWAGPLTPSLPDRIPAELEGWQTNVYLDAFGGTAGTTLIANAVTAWQVQAGNNLSRKYFAGNTLNAGATPIGALDVSASLTLEAAAAIAPTEQANWEALTNRLLRLEFLGPVDGIETGQREFVTIDVPGAWAAVNLNGSGGGTRLYEFNLDYLFSSALAAGLVMRCQCARTAAFA